MTKFLSEINDLLRGFRTYLVAVLVAIEPILTAAMLGGSVEFETLFRQVVLAAIIAGLRTITKTPPGRAG